MTGRAGEKVTLYRVPVCQAGSDSVKRYVADTMWGCRLELHVVCAFLVFVCFFLPLIEGRTMADHRLSYETPRPLAVLRGPWCGPKNAQRAAHKNRRRARRNDAPEAKQKPARVRFFFLGVCSFCGFA